MATLTAPDTTTVLIVPGLRDAVPAHWQTHLQARLEALGRPVVAVPPMGRQDLDCASKVAAIEASLATTTGPVVMVAHSGGCVMVAHWARQSAQVQRVVGALLATPPDFDQDLPEGYPGRGELAAGGWLPVPRQPLPFPSLVATSDNDPLARLDRVLALARDWGSAVVHLGAVGHLNPASGFGPWPEAEALILSLARP